MCVHKSRRKVNSATERGDDGLSSVLVYRRTAPNKSRRRTRGNMDRSKVERAAINIAACIAARSCFPSERNLYLKVSAQESINL